MSNTYQSAAEAKKVRYEQLWQIYLASPTSLTAANTVPRCKADLTTTKPWAYSKVHPLDAWSQP